MDLNSTDEYTPVLRLACDAALLHLQTALSSERSVAPSTSTLDSLAQRLRNTPLPDSPSPAEDAIKEIAELAGTAVTTSNGPRYFGFVTGGTLPVAAAADFLVTAFDQNAWSPATSPFAAHLEAAALRFLQELFKDALPPSCPGTFVSGCTVASIVALTAARDALLLACSSHSLHDGLFAYDGPPIEIFASAEAHSSVLKALRVVGLPSGPASRFFHALPVDDQGSVRYSGGAFSPEFFPAPPTGPAIVCLQAGHVNTGAFDDLEAIVAWARSRSQHVWVHVDGAFGLWAAASGEQGRRDLVRGSAGADSWAVDMHKMLNTPYDNAAVFVRDGERLRASLEAAAPYVPLSQPAALPVPSGKFQSPLASMTHKVSPEHDEPPSQAQPPSVPSQAHPLRSAPASGAVGPLAASGPPLVFPECQNSRRARGIVVWAVCKQLGQRGVADLIDRCCDCAALFAKTMIERAAEDRSGAQRRGGGRGESIGEDGSSIVSNNVVVSEHQAANSSCVEIVNVVVFNQVLVSFGSDEMTAAVAAEAQRDGRCWVGVTRWQGRVVLRFSVASWATTHRDIGVAVDTLFDCVNTVSSGLKTEG